MFSPQPRLTSSSVRSGTPSYNTQSIEPVRVSQIPVTTPSKDTSYAEGDNSGMYKVSGNNYYNSAKSAFLEQHTLTTIKHTEIDGLAVLVWSTKPNPLHLVDGPDPADIVSHRATLLVSKRKAHIFCEERRVVMEYLLAKDLGRIVLCRPNGKQGWTVALHSNVASSSSAYRDPRFGVLDDPGHFSVRKLPNGVVLRQGTGPSRSPKQATWATILVLCGNETIATSVVRLLEALKIREMQSIAHSDLPDRGIADEAMILQHRARELLARCGVRPEGVLPASAIVSKLPVPAKKITAAVRTSNASSGNKKGGTANYDRSPVGLVASPNDFEEIIGSDDDESSSTSDRGGSSEECSSSSSSNAEDDVSPYRQIVKRAFDEPFVSLKGQIAELLRNTMEPASSPSSVPPLAVSPFPHVPRTTNATATATTTTTMMQFPLPEPQQALTFPQIEFVPKVPTETAMKHSKHHPTQYEEILGSPRDNVSPVPSYAVVGGATQPSALWQAQQVIHTPVLSSGTSTPAKPTATERRTEQLIDRLRSDTALSLQSAPAVPILSNAVSAAATPAEESRRTTPPTSSLPVFSTQQPPPIVDPYLVATGIPQQPQMARDRTDANSETSSVHFEVEGPAPPVTSQAKVDKDTHARPEAKKSSEPISASLSSAPAIPPRKTAPFDHEDIRPPKSRPVRHPDHELVHPPLAALDSQPSFASVPATSTVLGPVASMSTDQAPSLPPRNSPALASGRFQLELGKIPAEDPAQAAAPRAVSAGGGATTPRSDRKAAVSIITPSRDASVSPTTSGGRGGRAQSGGAVSPSSRRCKWCKNVAPESHDDRCALRKIKCKKCGQVIQLKDRSAHHC